MRKSFFPKGVGRFPTASVGRGPLATNTPDTPPSFRGRLLRQRTPPAERPLLRAVIWVLLLLGAFALVTAFKFFASRVTAE